MHAQTHTPFSSWVCKPSNKCLAYLSGTRHHNSAMSIATHRGRSIGLHLLACEEGVFTRSLLATPPTVPRFTLPGERHDRPAGGYVTYRGSRKMLMLGASGITSSAESTLGSWRLCRLHTTYRTTRPSTATSGHFVPCSCCACHGPPGLWLGQWRSTAPCQTTPQSV